MTKMTEDTVLDWVNAEPVAEQREKKAGLASMWRQGLIELTQFESGEFYFKSTALGASQERARKQEDAPVCSSCKKSTGVIERCVVLNGRGEEVVEWLHEECCWALPVACAVCGKTSGDIKKFGGQDSYTHAECFPALPPKQFPWAPMPEDWKTRLDLAAEGKLKDCTS